MAREHRNLFFYGNDIQVRHLLQGLFDQITVPKGKGIGVHHDNTTLPFLAKRPQIAAVVFETLGTCFHEDGLRSLGQQAEAQTLEDATVSGFSENLDVFVASFVGCTDEV